MSKKFNDTGLCVPEKHFMVDRATKLSEVLVLINEESYFTISKPRQYGKSTMLFLLSRLLNRSDDFIALNISFEVFSQKIWSSEELFVTEFLELIIEELRFLKMDNSVDTINKKIDEIDSIVKLSRFITNFIKSFSNTKVVLMIDEVDKATNNQLFLDFLSMLRTKYSKRSEGKDFTFSSVILAGVHDVKSLKLRIPLEEESKFNSPWNIAADFKVNLSFNAGEIASMLHEYAEERQATMNIKDISEMLYYYTSGYPFLVSKLCKIIDEEIMGRSEGYEWTRSVLEKALGIILTKDNTNFASLTKNLGNNRELYELVFEIVINGAQIMFNRQNPLENFGVLYGIFREENRFLKIHNRLYEQIIYDYMTSVLETTVLKEGSVYNNKFIKDNELNLEMVLLKFQAFMKEQYSKKEKDFLERYGRLLFLAYVKPIINGIGFDFKEVQISEEKRLDVVITFRDRRYIIELKKWYGPAAHREGLEQLSDYLDRLNLNKGYLVIFETREKGRKEWKDEHIMHNGKDIFTIWV